MAILKDSGDRREFSSGAVRDIQEGKGRCDLMPLDIIANLMIEEHQTKILNSIHQFILTKQCEHLLNAIKVFFNHCVPDICTGVLDLSKHYEDGAIKYGERNWEKGISLHSYIDSGVRHLLKYFRGDDDEPHGRAFVWNMVGAIYTISYLSLDDIQHPLAQQSSSPDKIESSTIYDSDDCPLRKAFFKT